MKKTTRTAFFASLITLFGFCSVLFYSCNKDDNHGTFEIRLFNPYEFKVRLEIDGVKVCNPSQNENYYREGGARWGDHGLLQCVLPDKNNYYEGAGWLGSAGSAYFVTDIGTKNIHIKAYRYDEDTSGKLKPTKFDENSDPGELIGEVSFKGHQDYTYSWKVGKNNPVEEVTDDNSGSGGGSGSSIAGKWANKAGCKNKNGEYSYFQFSSGGSGKFFNSDCNSACEGYGIMFHFSYTVSGSSINLNFTKADDYCGRSVDLPSPSKETVSYSISGSTLTINGVSYTKM